MERRRWSTAALVGAAGFLLNLAPLELLPGTDLVFGGVAALLVAVALGPGPGLAAGVLATLPTLWLWNHPYALLIFGAEAWTVGYLVKRWDRRPLTADLLYWMVLGLPLLLLTYRGILGIGGVTATLLFLKQPFNGLLNALLVEVLLLVPALRRQLGIAVAPRLRTALAVVLALIAVVPALGLSVWGGQREWNTRMEQAEERVQASADAYGAQLEQYVQLHGHSVRSVARVTEARGVFDPVQLQRLITAERDQFPGFVNMYTGDSRGVAVAFTPPVGPRGDTLLGFDFGDRDYVRRLRESRAPLVSQVIQGRGGVDEPLVVIAAPVILADTFAGYVVGALDLRALPTPATLLADEHLRVTDADGVLVLDARAPYRPGDRPRDLGDSPAFRAVRSAGPGPLVFAQQGAVAPAAQTAAQVLAGAARLRSLGWWVWVEHPVRVVEARVARTYAGLLGFLVALLLLTIVFSGLLARWLARPLLQLRGVAAALASGDRRARVGPLPAASPAEIQELGRGFDEMAGSLAERARELEELGEIARSLASTLDADELLRGITDAAARLVAPDGCGIALLEPDGDTLRAAEYSLGLLAASAGKRERVDESLTGWVTRTGEPVLVPDLGSDPRASRTSRAIQGAGSAVCAPLVGRSGPLGALLGVRARSNARPFTHADLLLLDRLARQAAIAVENARLLNEAEAASRAKSEFIATMSHELRTPLNAVLGHLQLLEMGIHGPVSDAQREALGRIDAASRHLRGLIEEVLSFARLEAGRTETRSAPADVRALAEEVVAVIEPLAREKGLHLRPPINSGAETVVTDPDKVRQILINLAGNAVKFTQAGEVCMGVERRDGEVWIGVSDTGPGISDEDQARLFRPFEQLRGGLARQHGGTGLGLYLSRRYAELIGGRIELQSCVGEGSTFSLVLPARGSGETPPEPRPEPFPIG